MDSDSANTRALSLLLFSTETFQGCTVPNLVSVKADETYLSAETHVSYAPLPLSKCRNGQMQIMFSCPLAQEIMWVSPSHTVCHGSLIHVPSCFPPYLNAIHSPLSHQLHSCRFCFLLISPYLKIQSFCMTQVLELSTHCLCKLRTPIMEETSGGKIHLRASAWLQLVLLPSPS